MKNKIAIASAAFIAAAGASQAEIVINEYLSFEGFIDMSYAHYDGELDGITDESDNNFAIDQVEINWLFDFDPVTAQIDFDYEDNDEDTVEVEQAFANYHFDNGGTVTAGRYDSMLGFEAFEPTGLYQFSFAYGLPNIAGDLIAGLGGGAIAGDDVSAVSSALFPVGPRQSQGVKFTHDTDTTFFGISLQDGVSNYEGRLGGDNDRDGTGFDGGGYGIEVAGSVILADGLTWFLGAFHEDGDGLNTTNINTGDTEAYAINSYITFETGAWIFAGEVTYGENEWDSDLSPAGTLPVDLEVESLNALLMANFAYSDQGSITGRLSYVDSEVDVDTVAGDIEFDYLKYTLAHNWAFSDNLLLVTELSYTDGDIDDSTFITGIDEDFDELLLAAELIFSF